MDVALPPDIFNAFTAAVADQVQQASDKGMSPALVTSTMRRRFLRTILMAKNLSIPVLSFEEIGMDAKPALVGIVRA
jgi:flagellar biosynthesis protein FlhA